VEGGSMSMGQTHSVNDIRTAIRELSARADLARKEGRPEDAAEIEQRIAGYREELAERP
jgi:C4-dicarboxylate-specific signal transduction histidine kinase